jgi:hypothetical protein
MLNMISTKFHSRATGWRVFILFLAESLMMGCGSPDGSNVPSGRIARCRNGM